MNLLWIHCLYRDLNKNAQSVSRIYFVFTMKLLFFHEFTLNLLPILRIHYLLHEFTMNSIIFPQTHYEFTIFSRIHYEPTIYVANSLWTHYLSREFTVNRLSLSRTLYEFTIFFLNSPLIHCLFREFTRIILYIFWIHFESNFDFANSLFISRK